MFNLKLNYLSVGLLSTSLVACGGGGSSFSGITSLTTAQKQTAAEPVVDSADLYELVEGLLGVTSNIGNLDSGNLACSSGNGTRTVINNTPLNSFDNGDTIVIDATNCVAGNETLNGRLSLVGTATGGTTATFSNSGTGDGNFDGAIQITPTADYNASAGTGSIQITIGSLTITNGTNNITYKDGSYNFALSGNRYTYKIINHEITSNLFSGSLKAQTGTSGFTGTTRFDSLNDFVVSNPLAGDMTITFPDNSTATVDANTGSESTYDLTIDGQTTTSLWD